MEKNDECSCSPVSVYLLSIFFLCQLYVIPVNETQIISSGEPIFNLETIMNKLIKHSH